MATAMTETVTLLLPLPFRALSPNARVHWARRAQAASHYRDNVQAEAFRQWHGRFRPQFEYARLSVFFVVGNRYAVLSDGYRPRDADNALASFKNGIDALVSLGVLAADDAEHLSLRCCVVRAQMAGGLVAVCLEGEAA